jgi:Zn-dependent peptidase ImmA (M78 family)
VAAPADPSHRAREVLDEYERDYGYDGELPVPVDDLADTLARLRVLEVPDFAAVEGAPENARSLSGMLLCEPVNTIYVNEVEARRSRGRRRFTIAHELGHWYLHASHQPGERFERFCRDSDLKATRSKEGEANEFAGAVLMPEPLLREHAAAARMNIPLLAKRFDVSVVAMRRRLITLDILPSWMR